MLRAFWRGNGNDYWFLKISYAIVVDLLLYYAVIGLSSKNSLYHSLFSFMCDGEGH